MTGSRMHHHTSRLIHDQEVIIFINDIQGQCLWPDLFLLRRRSATQHLYLVISSKHITGLTRPPIDKYRAIVNELLYSSARETTQCGHQVTIEAQPHLLGLYTPVPPGVRSRISVWHPAPWSGVLRWLLKKSSTALKTRSLSCHDGSRRTGQAQRARQLLQRYRHQLY